MASIKYTNNAKTTLAADLNNSATSATVVNGNVLPSLSSGEHFYFTFDDGTNTEIVKVTARSTHVLTIVRAQDNTSARAFSSGDKAELRLTAVVLEEVSTSSSSWNTDIFAGDGSDTTFTLTQAATDEKYLQVYIDGAFQAHNTYSVSGTTLTFATAPANSRVITVYHIEPVALGTADTITATANNSADETVFPVFVDGATGTQGLETDTGFTYNPSSGVLTIAGELDAATLDISGDADIDGTLEADAITIAGVTLAETISDTVGAMVSSNTESGITVAYDDADNTLDFTVGTLNQNTTGSAATLTTARTIGGTSFDGSANIAVGLADTATVLATARTIGGVSFNGSANIDLPGVNTAGNQNTSGTAAVATTVTITDNENTNENNAIVFTAGGDLDGGNLGLESDGDLKYNPSTGTLSATNISVTGTLSTVDSVTMSANNAVVFEGATADAHETTLTVVDATADRTITLPNATGTVSLVTGTETLTNKTLTTPTLTGTAVVASLDISGDIDVDGTTNLDVVDIDGAVNMATTALVTGVLTTTAATVFNGGFAANDGSTITVNDNSENLKLITTDADASEGPILSMYRNSSSPADNDILGQLSFQGENSADEKTNYALIEAIASDVTNGTEDATLNLQSMSAGTLRSRLKLKPTETAINDDSQNLDFRVESDGLSAMLFVDAGNNRVGIGTASPTQTLDVNGTLETNALTIGGVTSVPFEAADHSKLDGIEASATADQSNAEIRAAVAAASDSQVFTDADHTKLNGIETSATADQTAAEILTAIKTVDGGGSGLDADLLDGISSASFLRSDATDTFTTLQGTTLTVDGVLSVRNAIDLADNDILRLGSSDDVELFFDGSHFYMDLNSGGNNFIIRDGTTTRFTFDDAGHFTATGNVTAFSDKRLKENIKPIEGAINKVQQLSGNTYTRNDLKDSNRSYAGVIAQEVEVVLPEAVSESEDGIKTVDYNSVIALLIESVKEQQKQINDLKERLDNGSRI